MSKKIILLLLIGLMLSSTISAQNFGRGRGACINAAQLPAQNVDEKEKAALIYMREEEKLAQDVYKILYEKWDAFIFNKIAGSENRHTEAIKILLDKYDIADPVKNNEVGVFTNTELKKLYDDLIAMGEKSLKDAFIVGATIEDVDIFDLNERITQTDNEDIRTVFNNLTKGSENHMRAFMRQLQRSGGFYKAQYISQKELDAITAATSGGRRGRGNGRWH